jgi:UDP-N-acetylmuramyl pentapeptide synthase
MQDNQVFVNDQDIIEIQAVGDQTTASIQAMGDRAHELALEHVKAGKRVIFLDDLLRLGTVPEEARDLVADLVKAGEFEKFAMLGTGEELRAEAEELLQETGRGSHVKYFEDREACITWLLQP